MTPAEIYATARPDRFGRTIRTDSPEGCRVALLGLPDDTGVALNGGRVGAKDGPRAFREALAKYGTMWYQPPPPVEMRDGRTVGARDYACDLSAIGVFDAGDVEGATGGTATAMEQTHERVTDKVRELLKSNVLPVCIGGGHDLTWPAVRAVAEEYPGLAGIYYDAHLDVREEPGSGMAFRKILTETSCRELIVEGLDPFANSRAHIEWFEAHGGRRSNGFWSPARGMKAERAFASFDLDCINAAQAPGVSAISVTGMDARTADRAAHMLGADANIVSFDIMELNPKYDIDGRTARLAARLFLSFLAGYAMRAQ